MFRHQALFSLVIACILGGCSSEVELPTEVRNSALGAADDGKRNPASIALSCSFTGKSHELLQNPVSTIELTLCESHFAEGSSAREALSRMVDEMNMAGASVQFKIGSDAAHTNYTNTFQKDGVFKIEMVDTSGCSEIDCSFDGRTKTYLDSIGYIEEFDIGFDSLKPWTYTIATSWEISDGQKHFSSVFLHEITHGIGFPHVLNATEDLSVMGHMTGKWNSMRRAGLKAYDIAHMLEHYPGTGIGPDLVLANYRTYYDATAGQWKIQLTESLSRTLATQGSSLTATWTEMNRGPAFLSDYCYRIYLSSDERIDDADIEVGYETRSGRQACCYVTNYDVSGTVSVPIDMEPGLWFVLVKVDADDDVDEEVESNNALALHEQLRVIESPRVRVNRQMTRTQLD